MCGRYAQSASIQQLVKQFAIDHVLLDWVARYNIAPSQNIPVITQDENGRSLYELRWGLIPHWAKEDMGSRLINARAETIEQKPSFRQAFRSWRCVIPADGFYEWQAAKGAGKKTKTPYYISRKDDESMAFAGLFEAWLPPGGDGGGLPIQTCTIVTTAANKLMRPIHHRMPVILNREQQDVWLNPLIDNLEMLRGCLVGDEGVAGDAMQAYTVSSRVNRVDYDEADCVERFIEPPPPQMNLFE